MTNEREAIITVVDMLCRWPVRHAVDFRRVEEPVDWYFQQEILDNHTVQFINGIPRWCFPRRIRS